jgi:hypothetical protein
MQMMDGRKCLGMGWKLPSMDGRENRIADQRRHVMGFRRRRTPSNFGGRHFLYGSRLGKVRLGGDLFLPPFALAYA